MASCGVIQIEEIAFFWRFFRCTSEKKKANAKILGVMDVCR
jgi:hypothetical protein